MILCTFLGEWRRREGAFAGWTGADDLCGIHDHVYADPVLAGRHLRGLSEGPGMGSARKW